MIIDNTSVKILKKIDDVVSKVISKLIYQACYGGKYPNCLKLITVISIYKSSSKKLPGKYKPIFFYLI